MDWREFERDAIKQRFITKDIRTLKELINILEECISEKMDTTPDIVELKRLFYPRNNYFEKK